MTDKFAICNMGLNGSFIKENGKIIEIERVVDLLNELSDENEQLKQQKDKWKQQCIHFKEMLDDMDITYLCDEWIYEELKGDVE